MSTVNQFKRKERARESVMRVFKDHVDERVALFADKSYALTQEGHFVPICPRHMSTDNWRDLFWLQPKRLVIRGKAYKSLCSVCQNALVCMNHKASMSFECEATAKTLTIKLRRGRRRRKDAGPVETG